MNNFVEPIKIKISKQFKNRIKNGYLWIFSNEIDHKYMLKQISYVEVYDHKDNFLCKGVYNPHSLISVRVLSQKKDEKIDKEFFYKKLKTAVERRKKYGIDIMFCRIIYGESDFLPGVVIDRYGDIFVLQFFSYGMELFKNEIFESLIDIFNPKFIVMNNDIYQRELESAPKNKEIVYTKNKSTNESITIIQHLDTKFVVDVLNGQKTGFYYDQLENRKYISSIAKDKNVLDLCCYTGSFSILCALSGSKNVVGVDSSSYAIKLANENAKINNVKVEFINSKVEDFVKNNKTKFDLIIFDPPSYTKSDKDINPAKKKYEFMLSQIMKMLEDKGLLAFSVCSRHISLENMQEVIVSSMLKNQQKGFIIYYGGQSKDHPIYLPMRKETEYLKFVVCEVFN
jgi:23S rRNA (cytosine1962-C5)-methyltransferase